MITFCGLLLFFVPGIVRDVLRILRVFVSTSHIIMKSYSERKSYYEEEKEHHP